MSKEIETAIDAWLAAHNITYSARHTGYSKDDDGWEHDSWIVAFDRNRKSMRTDYRTGLGHRTPGKLPRWKVAGMGRRETERWHRENDKPVKPHATGVLASLVRDVEALDTSFTYWCDELGYSSDSLKALNIYNNCCEVGKKFYSIFSRAEADELRTLLQDY